MPKLESRAVTGGGVELEEADMFGETEREKLSV